MMKYRAVFEDEILTIQAENRFIKNTVPKFTNVGILPLLLSRHFLHLSDILLHVSK